MEGPKKYGISKRALAEFRRILREEHGIEPSAKQAREAAEALLGLMETLGRHKHSVRRMEERLAKSPEGYELPPDSKHSCRICGGRREWGRAMWFDRTGVKCGPCYMTFRRRALPLSVATDRDSWYDERELMHRFGLSGRKVDALVREGKLVARTVTGTGFRIFLISENPSLPFPKPGKSC